MFASPSVKKIGSLVFTEIFGVLLAHPTKNTARTNKKKFLIFHSYKSDLIAPSSTLFGVSGSNTVSNLTFGSVQLSTAETTGLSVTLILALQSVGGAMGNMVCINNIVAVSSVLNIQNKEGTIIKTTIVPMVVYGIIAALCASFLIPLFYAL